jgi:bifunctional DNA-binding transcriptional regulator/antitoxin component of YhaV-PrlF toxin-antitoxin module
MRQGKSKTEGIDGRIVADIISGNRITLSQKILEDLNLKEGDSIVFTKESKKKKYTMQKAIILGEDEFENEYKKK